MRESTLVVVLFVFLFPQASETYELFVSKFSLTKFSKPTALQSLRCFPRLGNNYFTRKKARVLETFVSTSAKETRIDTHQDILNSEYKLIPFDMPAVDGHSLRLWYKPARVTVANAPVWVLLHGRTWSSVPVSK